MTTDLLDRLAALAQRDRAFTTTIIQACRAYAEDYPHLRYYHLLDRTGGGEWDRTRLDMATDGWPRLLEALGLNPQQEDLVVLPGHTSSRETTIIFAGQGHLEYEELAQRLTAAWHDAGFDDNDGQLLASIWLFIGGGGNLPCQPGFPYRAHRFYAPGISGPEAFLVARTGQLFQATAAALEYLLAPRPPKGKSSGEKKSVAGRQQRIATSGCGTSIVAGITRALRHLPGRRRGRLTLTMTACEMRLSGAS